MAKKPNDKRTARIEKNKRSMNSATALIIACFVAEFYLLLIYNNYVRATASRLLKTDGFLRVLIPVGAVLAAAGAAAAVLKRGTRWGAVSAWAAGCGAFFALTSLIIRSFFPAGTTALLILVPVVMILGVIFLMYQREFAVEATSLSAAITALVLINVGGGGTSRVCAVLALAAFAAILVCSAALRKKGGVVSWKGANVRVFAPNADYRLLWAVVGLCFAAVLVSLLVPVAAFYGIWALAVLAFALAVYYTVKIM